MFVVEVELVKWLNVGDYVKGEIEVFLEFCFEYLVRG